MIDCELNKMLAEVAGVVTWEDSAPRFTAVPGRLLCQPGVGRHTGIWNPLTDHNQMALVKAGLFVSHVNISEVLINISGLYTCVNIWEKGQGISSWFAKAPDELRAIAIAIAKMREERNDQTNR